MVIFVCLFVFVILKEKKPHHSFCGTILQKNTAKEC